MADNIEKGPEEDKKNAGKNTNVMTTAPTPNASTSVTTTNQNAAFSLESMSQFLREITDDYLKSISGKPVPSPGTIADDLVAKVNKEMIAINSFKESAKESKWKQLTDMTDPMIAQVMLAIYPIRAIALGGLDANSTFDVVGIYENKGPNEGIYDTDGKRVRNIIRSFNSSITKYKIKEVETILKDQAERVTRTTDPRYAPVGNGVFDFESKTLIPFSKAYDMGLVFTAKCPVDYNPKAVDKPIIQPDGSEWHVLEWLWSLSKSDGIYKLMLEVLATCVRTHLATDKSIWLYSTSGANGKGSFSELCRQLAGPNNCASISLDDFGKDYMLTPLINATCIINDENDTNMYMEHAGKFKAVVTGDRVMINVKYHDPISLRFRGPLIQCLNSMPHIGDKSDSFFRRQIFIPFEKSYTGMENKDIKNKYIKDKQVLEFLLKIVLAQNFDEYDVPEECIVAQRQYKVMNDPVRQFMDEYSSRFAWTFVPFTFIHDAYKAFYKDNFGSEKCMSTQGLALAITQIIKDYPEWAVKEYGTDFRPRHFMDGSEPLIDELKLDKWLSPHYRTSANRALACTPPLAAKYKGGLFRLSEIDKLPKTKVDSRGILVSKGSSGDEEPEGTEE